jgi:acetyl-coA carboxylase, biotin carboxyl carrier protein
MKIDEIILLMEALNKNNIDEVEYVSSNGEKIAIRKNQTAFINTSNVQSQSELSNVVSSNTFSQNLNAENAVPKAIEDIRSDKVITSPLVGTFYLAASPKEEPFVKVGDSIKKGQIVGIIEAMKLMNEVESEFDGVIKEILIGNEEVVEYGQPLFRVG